MNASLCLVALFVASPILVAQKTWVVDGTGGGDFKTVQAAFDAAAAGDRILVNAGSYASATTSRGFFLLGRGNPYLGGLTVNNMRAGQSFVMKSFTVLGPMVLSSNKGRVHLENVSQGFSVGSAGRGLSIASCAQVSIARGTFTFGRPSIQVTDSTAYLTGVTAIGAIASFSNFSRAQPALTSATSRLIIAGGFLGGGSGVYSYQHGSYGPAPAIVLTSGAMTIGGDATTRIAAGATTFYGPQSSSAIVTYAGSLRLAPTVVVTGTLAAGVAGNVQPKIEAFPTLGGSGAPPGGSVTVDLFGVAGSNSILYVSLPGHRVPFVFGDIWLDLNILFPVRAGTIPSPGHWISTISVDGSFPRGTPLAFQALNVDGKKEQLSTPLTVLLH